MSSLGLRLDDLLIPLEEIRSATKHFSQETLIGECYFSKVYNGQFTERLQNRTAAVKRFLKERYKGPFPERFLNELILISKFDHENIIPFIGYCDEGDEMIIVSEYAIKGSLEDHLRDPNKMLSMTWPQRLKICLGAAKAINYLHFGLSEGEVVIHKNIKSRAILLDKNVEAKICNFVLSMEVGRKKQHNTNDSHRRGSYYMDPIYLESRLTMREVDVYSFGMVMFELLSGTPGDHPMKIEDNEPLPMIKWVRRYYNIDGLDKLIDSQIRDQTDRRSLDTFKETAYRCISYNLNDRPSMDRIIKRITESLDIHNHAAASITIRSHLHQKLEIPLIPLEEIRLATSDFSDENWIGTGRFGTVYKGQLSGRWENRTSTFKRHDPESEQGESEFRKELQMMSSLSNIRLIGYCDEGGEMILIYDYAVNGSLRSHQNLEIPLIPLEEIRLATSDFSPENRIGYGGFGYVYKGQLSGRWENRTFAFKGHDRHNGRLGEAELRNELHMMSSLRHKNIIRLIGYCNEGGEMILIYDYAVNRSLRSHLDKNLMTGITWVQRLKIGIGAARGLQHLQASHGEDKILVHRNVNRGNILLDDNMEPLICGLGLSIVVDRNKGQVYDKPVGAFLYIDPIYNESGIIKSETDVYPLGVVLYEMLNGKRCDVVQHGYDIDEGLILINLVRWLSNDDAVVKLIDPCIKDQIDIRSFLIYKEIASKCMSLNLKDRPSFNRIIKRLEEALRIQEQADASTIATRSQLSHQDKKLEEFRIPLEEIRLATGNFRKEIGKGGFGVVYKGQLSERWQNCTVAIKRVYQEGHQGNNEFQNELNMMFKFHHQNIVNFLGYCNEDNEMIIVNEYASNGSLEDYLADVLNKKRRSLTWVERLRICIGAAKGLDYLHWGLGENNRVIHRDVKGGNILLDDNLEAKICDFGLSKSGPTNKPQSKLYTKAAGTRFYMDPLYNESGILQKESDVYSLGVVLFEMLTGLLAYCEMAIEKGNEPQYLINLVRRYFDDGLDTLIDPFIKDQIDRRSFHTFKYVAYECISLNSKDRPTIDTIIDRLEEALEFQVSKESQGKLIES